MRAAQLEITTRSAHWGYDEHLYFGHAVFAELAGQESMTGLLALSVLGRRLSQDECGVLDDAAGCLTLADPRIWPLKLTRLLASYGSMGPAVAAGLLSVEEARIGPAPMPKAAQALVELHAKIEGHQDDADRVDCVMHEFLDNRPIVWGFGTPFRDHDERLVAFRTCMQKRKRDTLPFWRTMDALISRAKGRRKLEPNIGLAVGAAFLDLGFSVSEIGPLSFTAMFHMFLANGVEGAAQASEVLRELPKERIEYVGRTARKSPRFDAAQVNL